MKATILFFSLALFSIKLFAQNKKEESFLATAKLVITKLSHNDSAGLARYIHPKKGIYTMYVNGIRETYNHYYTIGFSDTTFPNVPFYEGLKYVKIKYESLPVYNCDNSTWSKRGGFVDTIKTDHRLSKTAKWLNKNFGEKISSKTINSIIALEAISRRIVITDNKQNDIVFYLSWIDNKWWLTILDKATTDCSA